MMNNYEANCCLVEKGMKICCENLRGTLIPEKGIFSPFRASFAFRGSKNKAFFIIEYESGDLRWLRFMAVRPGSDMVVSHYMKKGTNQELIEYLSDKSSIKAFVEDFQHLSDSVDDKHD